nr:efflux pump bik6 [Quercus suber]
MSEVYGRKWPVVLPFFLSTVFSFATATAKDIQTVLITRFFTGFFGCASITCTGGVFVDLWDASHRGHAIVGYTLAVTYIPVTGIFQAVIFVLIALTAEESYVPILLSAKAKHLRRETGEWALHAAADETDTHISDLAIKFGLRPIQMLATPICLFTIIYASFIYGLYYASLASFPIIYQETRGWNDLVGALPFLAAGLGILVGAALNIWNQKYYMRAYTANNFANVPEARLPPMMIASIVLPAGLFIMGWTSSPEIPWIAPVVGTFMMGFGFYVIFTSSTSYLIDVYQRWGASALAANTFVRSAFAAGLPLIVPYMYAGLGNGRAFSVLGFFAILNIPVPFVFWKYGVRLRKMGKYTSNMG